MTTIPTSRVRELRDEIGHPDGLSLNEKDWLRAVCDELLARRDAEARDGLKERVAELEAGLRDAEPVLQAMWSGKYQDVTHSQVAKARLSCAAALSPSEAGRGST